ncbi:MAG: ubiquitin-like protein Pup [Ancrocorticia sp.]|uniref:ubiquitin-like protein Pup n=1 Tax=Ancrocorticia sp. TaxID=2593684 RepID=UPI003F938296
MSSQEQEFAQHRRQVEESEQVELPQAQAQTQSNQVDSLLDEIDSVLETNASAFVQGFVQKGGQ